MKKQAIIYASVHHGNTEKLITEAAKAMQIELFKVEQAGAIDFSQYSSVGFASGIYAGRFHKSIFKFIESHQGSLPKTTFTVCTSGAGTGWFARKFSAYLRKKGFAVLGEFECKGFDTFGPFKLFGGFAKGHPDSRDIENCIAFFQNLVNTSQQKAYDD
ncbi:MAG: flavodoxin domain-containing protein [Treponema sp.]